MKILQEIEKDYKKINITILSLCIYLLFFHPIISTILEYISPFLTKCTYLQITGKPCPLCGGTRFLKNIKNIFYDFSYVFNFFGIVILVLILEIIFRILNIKNNEYKNINKVVKIDIITHIILLISYIMYVIWFINK